MSEDNKCFIWITGIPLDSTSFPAYSGYGRFEGDSLGYDLKAVSIIKNNDAFAGLSSIPEPDYLLIPSN